MAVKHTHRAFLHHVHKHFGGEGGILRDSSDLVPVAHQPFNSMTIPCRQHGDLLDRQTSRKLSDELPISLTSAATQKEFAAIAAVTSVVLQRLIDRARKFHYRASPDAFA